MLAGYYKSPARQALADRLVQLPGFVGAGVVLQNPHAPRSVWRFAYEVRWLHGRAAPSLPARVEGHPVKLVYVSSYPIPYRPR